MKPTHIITLLLLTGLMAAMSNSVTAAQPAATKKADSHINKETQALMEKLKSQPNWMSESYASVGYQYLWSDGSKPSKNYHQLIKHMKSANRNGLRLSYYPINKLKSMRDASALERELFTASVYANYLHDLSAGKTNPSIHYSDDFEAQRLKEKSELLGLAFESGDPVEYLENSTPDNFLVERLIDTLATYRSFQSESEWKKIHMTTNKLELGMQDKAVSALRARLVAEGLMDQQTGVSKPSIYDKDVEAGVKAFQKSRSMLDDGIVGENTIDALNEPLKDLIQKIEINIERARWLPSSFSDRAILVNIADYKLRLLEQEDLVDTINVVVGTDRNETDVFAENMTRVVVNPYWNIPRSIVQNELAIDMQKDPEYLKKKNIEVLSGWNEDAEVIDDSTIDWEQTAAGDFSFRLRQKPGKENSLGQIKFLFPNEFDIYLHDTPAEALFDKDKRAFSHGCIRVEKPIELADFVFKNNSEWDGGLIESKINSKERVSIRLDQEIPVYITYFTAWTDPDGVVSFARDIYDRDEELITKLTKVRSN